jgi:hypothetical protein
MQFKGTCIAVEDSSYQSKKSGLVPQMTLTCFDADTVSRLKDTVDVVLPKEDYDRINEHPLNKTFTFHVRDLVAAQPALDRPEATCAALIPITKTAAWWDLSHDERRDIFERRSSHIATGLRYLPAVARRLHHCRDLGEPFDFLTWFEYAPSDAAAFEELVAALRSTEEWNYVEREVDIRLTRDDVQEA